MAKQAHIVDFEQVRGASNTKRPRRMARPEDSWHAPSLDSDTSSVRSPFGDQASPFRSTNSSSSSRSHSGAHARSAEDRATRRTNSYDRTSDYDRTNRSIHRHSGSFDEPRPFDAFDSSDSFDEHMNQRSHAHNSYRFDERSDRRSMDMRWSDDDHNSFDNRHSNDDCHTVNERRSMNNGREDRQSDDVIDDEENVQESDTLRDRLDRCVREHRKHRADRAFDRTVKDDVPTDDSTTSSRAALYRAQMDTRQRKASRMHADATRDVSTKHMSPSKQHRRHHVPVVALSIAACVVFSCALLYPAAQQYYVALRQDAQAQAEYNAVAEHNQGLQSQIDALSTDEGIEDYARTEYGWVKDGENAVVVSDVSDDSAANAAEQRTNMPSKGSVPAPTTWYSDALDALFGYTG